MVEFAHSFRRFLSKRWSEVFTKPDKDELESKGFAEDSSSPSQESKNIAAGALVSKQSTEQDLL